jgi:hypothetical protein
MVIFLETLEAAGGKCTLFRNGKMIQYKCKNKWSISNYMEVTSHGTEQSAR